MTICPHRAPRTRVAYSSNDKIQEFRSVFLNFSPETLSRIPEDKQTYDDLAMKWSSEALHTVLSLAHHTSHTGWVRMLYVGQFRVWKRCWECWISSLLQSYICEWWKTLQLSIQIWISANICKNCLEIAKILVEWTVNLAALLGMQHVHRQRSVEGRQGGRRLVRLCVSVPGRIMSE